MQLKKLALIILLMAVVVGIITYAATDYIPVAATPAATLLPKKVEEKPQFLFSFGNTGNSKLKQPISLAVNDQGKIYITDAGDSNVKIYLPNGKYYRSFGSKGTGNSKFGYPYGIVVLKNGDIAVADSINLNVRVFSNSGKYKKTLIDAKQKIRPGALSVNKDGQIFVSDLLNHQIVVFSSSGKIIRKFKPTVSSLKYPQEVSFSGGGQNLWIADSGNFAVKEIDTKGLVVQTIKGWGSPQQAFSLVRGIGADNLNRLMVADTINGTIHVMTQDGREIFGFGGQDVKNSLVYPSFIMVDRSGKIYIADRGAGQIQVWGYRN